VVRPSNNDLIPFGFWFTWWLSIGTVTTIYAVDWWFSPRSSAPPPRPSPPPPRPSPPPPNVFAFAPSPLVSQLISQGDSHNRFALVTLTEVQASQDLELLAAITQLRRNDIAAIIRIDHCFQKQRVQAMQQHSHQPIQPNWVWHGTDIDALDKILQQGFAVPPLATHGRIMGQGIYLAKDVSKSLKYARKKGDNQRHVLLCELYASNPEPLSMSFFHTQFQASDPTSEAGLCNDIYVVWQQFMNSNIDPRFIVSLHK